MRLFPHNALHSTLFVFNECTTKHAECRDPTIKNKKKIFCPIINCKRSISCAKLCGNQCFDVSHRLIVVGWKGSSNIISNHQLMGLWALEHHYKFNTTSILDSITKGLAWPSVVERYWVSLHNWVWSQLQEVNFCWWSLWWPWSLMASKAGSWPCTVLCLTLQIWTVEVVQISHSSQPVACQPDWPTSKLIPVICDP